MFCACHKNRIEQQKRKTAGEAKRKGKRKRKLTQSTKNSSAKLNSLGEHRKNRVFSPVVIDRIRTTPHEKQYSTNINICMVFQTIAYTRKDQPAPFVLLCL